LVGIHFGSTLRRQVGWSIFLIAVIGYNGCQRETVAAKRLIFFGKKAEVK
jgi:hypothetical protein